MDKGSKQELTLQRMEHGGYLVMQFGRQYEIGQMLFASSTIEEALKFMDDMIRPIGPQSGIMAKAEI